ncbi:unnamed protein product [Lepeophtheirus salmonis]|uniref:(salmon louse) hypothetical protein n=1 Tax=Lepeophtheirus salmonis TaxID=72036 RepID=A0A7R8H364_LEPSM|nr:unnamed protein product [Lepeophtheirus salmonis]CAF2837395.1 unnamed protein product [Lepeophtheirus salmonis]
MEIVQGGKDLSEPVPRFPLRQSPFLGHKVKDFSVLGMFRHHVDGTTRLHHLHKTDHVRVRPQATQDLDLSRSIFVAFSLSKLSLSTIFTATSTPVRRCTPRRTTEKLPFPKLNSDRRVPHGPNLPLVYSLLIQLQSYQSLPPRLLISHLFSPIPVSTNKISLLLIKT